MAEQVVLLQQMVDTVPSQPGIEVAMGDAVDTGAQLGTIGADLFSQFIQRKAWIEEELVHLHAS